MKKLLFVFLLLLLNFVVRAQVSNTWLIGQDEQIQWDTTTVVRTPSLTAYLLKSDSTLYTTLYRLDTTRAAIDLRYLSASTTSQQNGYFTKTHYYSIPSTYYLELRNSNTTATAHRSMAIDIGDADRTLTLTGNTSLSGTNTGDNAINSLYSGLVTNATHTGDATGATALTVVALNGTNLAGLGTGLLKNTTGTGIPSIITDNSTNWNTAHSDRLKWDGGATDLVAATGRTSLGGTTIGQNIFTSTNPGAITFGRANADNSFTWLNAADFRTAIGAGTGSGTVTSIGVSTANGISGSSSGGATPSLTLALGAITPTSINTGTTLNGVGFFKSTTDIALASTTHAATFGGEANSTNLALGEYSTGVGLQARNNGAVAALYQNPLGGDIQVGSSTVGVQNFIINNTDAGTGSYIEMGLRNGAASADGLLFRTLGTGFTTSGMNFQDGAFVATSTNLSGGLSIGTQASAAFRVYTNNTLRTTWAAATGDISTTGQVLSSGGGIGYTTGAGGTVTQITSRTTSVTNNKLCGTITMFSAAQAANALVTFTLTNSFIAATDYVLVQHISATNGGAWNVSVVAGAGSATINIRNVSTASITEATPLRFTIIKATTN